MPDLVGDLRFSLLYLPNCLTHRYVATVYNRSLLLQKKFLSSQSANGNRSAMAEQTFILWLCAGATDFLAGTY